MARCQYGLPPSPTPFDYIIPVPPPPILQMLCALSPCGAVHRTRGCVCRSLSHSRTLICAPPHPPPPPPCPSITSFPLLLHLIPRCFVHSHLMRPYTTRMVVFATGREVHGGPSFSRTRHWPVVNTACPLPPALLDYTILAPPSPNP